MKPEQYSKLNLREAVELLYPNQEQLFGYDTAKPAELVRRIVDIYIETLWGQQTMKSMSDCRSEIYGHLMMSVYAYGKNDAHTEGFIPLTNECRRILTYAGQMMETHLIFTPTLENLRPTQVSIHNEKLEYAKEYLK